VPVTDLYLAATITPDGEIVAMVTDAGIVEVDLKTKRRLVIVPVGTGESVFSPHFSADGTKLAFGWRGSGRGAPTEWRVISREGGPSRTVLSRPGLSLLEDWSRDGKYLLAAFAEIKGEHVSMAVVSIDVADGSTRILTHAGEPGLGRAIFSPDGRFVMVADLRDSTQPSPLRVVAVDGSESHLLMTDEKASQVLLDWTATGEVRYLQDGQLNAVATKNGRASSPPRVVATDITSAYGVGSTTSGSLVVAKVVRDFDLYVARLNPETGVLIGAVQPLPGFRPEVLRGPPVWSPDGTLLAYGVTGDDWIVRTMATGAERRYGVGLSDARNPAWQPNGKAIVIRGIDASQRPGLYRLDLDTGKVDFLWRGWRMLYGPEGREVIYSVGENWLQRNLATTAEQPIALQGPGSALARSHDGRLLAVLDGATNTVAIASTDGVSRRTVVTDIPALQTTNFEFSPDDRFVYFVSGSRESTVWRVSVAGGPATSTGITMRAIHDMSLSPDGRQLVLKSHSQVLDFIRLDPPGR